ncbi:MAG: IS21 family transposase, partial [Polyangiaceae bacterium]
ARGTRIDRKTVRRYIEMAEQIGIDATAELTDAIVHEVAQSIQSRPLAEPSEAWRAVEPHRAQLETWIEQGLRMSRMHALLVRDGNQVTYATLRRYAMRELGWRKPGSTVRLCDPPAGQEAQIDFAEMGRVVDIDTGKTRRMWVLIVTLSSSRHSFVWPTFSQTTHAVIEALEAAWKFFDGMPKTLVPDNASSMVVGVDATSPKLNEVFAEYTQARGIFVDPARVRRPRDKAKVERNVTYVRDGWFAGETTCKSIFDWRRSAEAWCRDVAGSRVHGTTRKVPRDEYALVEKAAMLAAPTAPFDVPSFALAKVHPDHHIQVARSLYSVPTMYLGKQVRVRFDSKTVRIYVGTELVKVHMRQPPGGRATDPNDYPAGKSIYALRSVDALKKKASERGQHVGEYAERLLGGPLPWTQMRAAYALLSLCDKYGDGAVESVCQSALALDCIDVKRIRRMLMLGRGRSKTATGDNVVQLRLPMPRSRFERADAHFRTRKEDSK